MRGLPSILSLYRNEFDKLNNTRTRMLYLFIIGYLDCFEISFLPLKRLKGYVH